MHADEARLTQVLANLVNNSCKYTNPGGRIAVSATRVGDDVLITVSDNGIGIPQERLADIFDMFTQIDQSAERAQGGLGIGLTLVKRLVRMHGGTVEARSRGKGLGSDFEVRLPVMVEQPAAADSAEGLAERDVAPRRILVVDDNEDAAASLVMLLQMTGHETWMAHDGLAAIEAAEKHRPDVVFLDIGLPGLNGHEVCRRIRKRPWGNDVVLVALTGWGQEEDQNESRAAGFDSHLVKPIDYAALTALLSAVAKKKSSVSGVAQA